MTEPVRMNGDDDYHHHYHHHHHDSHSITNHHDEEVEGMEEGGTGVMDASVSTDTIAKNAIKSHGRW